MESPGPSPVKSALPMVFYALVVVGTAAIVLALYNLIVLRWCSSHRNRSDERRNPLTEAAAVAGTSGGTRIGLAVPASFRFKKEMAAGEDGQHCECAVCLSAFEEGEEIRRLPRCRHAFHAPCIDMWLFSHSDCPLCRAPVRSREGLLVSSAESV